MRYLAALMVAALIIVGAVVFSWWNHDIVARLFADHKRPFDPRALPVTIHVVDFETGKPIPEFRYQYRIRTAGEGMPVGNEDWRIHKSDLKALEIQAPVSCQLLLDVKAREHQGGYYRMHHTFDVKTADEQRKFSVRMERGLVVKGTVRDARTRLPVPGAAVMPHKPVWPGFRRPDDERAVLTDQNGRFTVPGVTPVLGVFVSHRDYLDATIETNSDGEQPLPKTIKDKEVLLDSGRTIEGKVLAPDGRPLDNVEVSYGLRRCVQTDKNGAFVMRGLEAGRKIIDFKKRGYISSSVDFVKDWPLKPVVLEQVYALRGRVVNSDGKPVRQFLIVVGPGPNPPAYSCVEATIKDGDGSFFLHLKETGIHWMGVRADGHAAWEGWIEVARNVDPVTIKLEPGLAVSGKIELPSGTTGGVKVTLTPRRSDGSPHSSATPARDVATLQTVVEANGSFTFHHVRPDDYVMSITGKHISEQSRPVNISAETDLGAIPVQRAGRIVGQVFHGGGDPWSFADVEISLVHETGRNRDPIRITADEDGRFQVDAVPIGMNRVSIPYHVSDFVFAKTRETDVLPERTSGVSFSPSGGLAGAFRQNIAWFLAGNWCWWGPAVVVVCLGAARVTRRRG